MPIEEASTVGTLRDPAAFACTIGGSTAEGAIDLRSRGYGRQARLKVSMQNTNTTVQGGSEGTFRNLKHRVSTSVNWSGGGIDPQ